MCLAFERTNKQTNKQTFIFASVVQFIFANENLLRQYKLQKSYLKGKDDTVQMIFYRDRNTTHLFGNINRKKSNKGF